MALKKQTSTGATGTSPTTKTSTSTTSSTGTRKSVGGSNSPTKRPSRIGGASPTKSPKKIPATAAVASSLSGIMGLMMDKICPTNLATSEGLGADNMTGILIEF